MPKKHRKKEYQARRKFSLRRDATVATGQREIEKCFGLPSGSVILRLPSQRRARGDKKIDALLKDWGI